MKEAFAGVVLTVRKGSFSKVEDSDPVVADDCLFEVQWLYSEFEDACLLCLEA